MNNLKIKLDERDNMSTVQNGKTRKAVDGGRQWQLFEDCPEDSLVYPGPIMMKNDPMELVYANKLIAAAKKNYDGKQLLDYTINVDNVMFRVHRGCSVNGIFYSIRQLPSALPKFEDIIRIEAWRDLLLSPYLLKGGLVIIAGAAGHGKSTTCATMIRARLEKYGGFCYTIEDPPEMPLNGYHGNGYCIQTEFSKDPTPAISEAARCFPVDTPSMLLIGEVRDPVAAAALLQVAANGQLVLMTMHAGSPIEAINRLVQLASSNGTTAIDLLPYTLRMVFHQVLDSVKGSLSVRLLCSPGHDSSVAVKIKTRKTEQLTTDLQRQQNLIRTGKAGELFS